MAREENVKIFEDTEALCRSNQRLAESIQHSVAVQKLILETDACREVDKNRYADVAKVVVSKKRSFEAARGYAGQKVAVHNFASASNPGGGVVTGASAQEECLCRCSTLYFCLKTPFMQKHFYQAHKDAHDPLHNDDIIYTPDVLVFKTDTGKPERMQETDWYSVDVITCAAPNLRAKPSNRYNSGDGNRAVSVKSKDLLAMHEKRLRRILDTALAEGAETVILGAFGCGAFENSPEIVAMAAKNVLGDYLHAFRNIEYAVYCSPKDERNFQVFARVLKPYCK